MPSSARHLTSLLAILLHLALLAACSAHLPAPQASPTPPLPTIHQIALLPVIFNDRAQDRYVEHRAGEEILWQTRDLLESKGYPTIVIDDPSLRSFITPFAPKLTSPAALVARAPATSDAILLIRIDNFLDAEIYGGGDLHSGISGGGNGTLDIYATAQLILRHENRIAWQKQGYGSGGDSGIGSLGFHETQAARDLVNDLFSALPPND